MTFYRRRGKRWLDVTVASMALLVSSPVHLICVILVRTTSGRPVYFAQERIGLDGRSFRLFKLRTMQVGTHEASRGYPTPAMVTPPGKFLRKMSLDEIPQLWNIIRGDMSLVGPRPALTEQVERYTPEQRMRLAVRPGLTGLAQIRYRNNAPWSLRIESDREYIRYLSFVEDLRIIARTLPAVMTGGSVRTGQTQGEVDDLGPKVEADV